MLEDLLGGKDTNGEITFTVEYTSAVNDLPGIRGIKFKRKATNNG